MNDWLLTCFEDIRSIRIDSTKKEDRNILFLFALIFGNRSIVLCHKDYKEIDSFFPQHNITDRLQHVIDIDSYQTILSSPKWGGDNVYVGESGKFIGLHRENIISMFKKLC